MTDVTEDRVLRRTIPELALFLLIGFVLLVFAYKTVHSRPPEELSQRLPSMRTEFVITTWLRDGYFHSAGLMPHDRQGTIYVSSTGGSLVSTYVLQKLYKGITGHYSWRLTALHNQIVAMLFSACLGYLAFRVVRRIGLDFRLAFPLGAAVVMVVFTFPDALSLYWEINSQSTFLLFASIFLVIEESCLDGRRTRARSIAQAIAAFLLTYMEYICGLAFIAAYGITIFVLERRRGDWRRYVLIAVVPMFAAFALYGVQRVVSAKRFPDARTKGSTLIHRTGLDGESRYYGDHLDIARRRDVARNNWPANRQYLFRWKSVFILGTLTILALVGAYIAGRVPRFVVEMLTAQTGTWILYAAVFSQSIAVHPYLYDVLLFVPLAIGLFAFLPALAESLTRRTGAIVLVAVFCACWYTFFQMRLYMLQWPMPGAIAGAPPPASP